MQQIVLTRGYVALVDDEDFDRVSNRSWHALVVKSGLVYAASKTGGRLHGRTLLLHREILVGKKIDHIDGNGLNCVRSNLRVATMSQNQWNKRKGRSGSSTSRYKGVDWHRLGKKWRARIVQYRVSRHLGLFVSEEDAARAYDAAARRLFGEFAALNFPGPGERSGLRPQ